MITPIVIYITIKTYLLIMIIIILEVLALMVLFYIFIIILILAALSQFIIYIKSKKFFKLFFLNAVLGLAILIIIKITTKFSGVYLPINLYTVVGSSVFGLPAIIGFLILNFVLF